MLLTWSKEEELGQKEVRGIELLISSLVGCDLPTRPHCGHQLQALVLGHLHRYIIQTLITLLGGGWLVL